MNIRIGFWLLCLISLVACKGKTSGVQDTLFSGVIRVAVDETLSPLAEDEIAVFEAQYNQTGIVPIYTSEVDAITLLLRDSVRWVLATRPLSGDELESFHSNKFFPESIKIATDGVALIVNRQNADSIFNVSTLKKIFSGEITRWNQLSADSKLGEIQVVFDHRIPAQYVTCWIQYAGGVTCLIDVMPPERIGMSSSMLLELPVLWG